MARITRTELSGELAKARQGDRAAQGRVAEFCHSGEVLNVVHAIAYGPMNRDDVCSIIDEALVAKIFNPKTEYHERSHAYAWIVTICKNKVRDACKKERKLKEHESKYTQAHPEMQRDNPTSPAENAEVFRKLLVVSRDYIRQSLRPVDMTVLGMCFKNHKTPAIAQTSGLTKQAVNGIKRKGYLKLAEHFQSHYPNYVELLNLGRPSKRQGNSQ